MTEEYKKNYKIKTVVKDDEKYSSEDKTSIVNRIQNLQNNENYYDIFKILKNNGVKYTPNTNGVFLQFGQASDETIDELVEYLNKAEKKTKKKKSGISIDAVSENLGLDGDDSEDLDSPNGTFGEINDTTNRRDKKISNHEKAVLRRSKKVVPAK